MQTNITASGQAAQAPQPANLAHASQIVAGVVIKYVNFALGWRTRLLVLQGDTIRYWKLGGEDAVDVYRLFSQLRQQGTLQVLGLEAMALEKRCQQSSNPDAPVQPPAAEVYLKVAKVRESKSDPRRFKLDTGNGRQPLLFKAEDQEQRWRWVTAINDAQAAWHHLNSHLARALSFKTQVQQRQADSNKDRAQQVAAELQRRGAQPQVMAYVQEVVTEMQEQHARELAEERSAREMLLKVTSAIANERRELEQQLALTPSAPGLKPSRPSGRSLSTDMDNALDEPDALHYNPDEDEPGADDASSDLDLEDFEDADATKDWLSRASVSSAGSVRSMRSARSRAPSMASTPTAAANGTAAAAAAAAGLAGGAVAAAAARGSGEEQRRGSEASAASAAGMMRAAPAEGPGRVNLKRKDTEQAIVDRRMPAWVAEEGPPPMRRTALPRPSQQEKPVSLWAIIKEMVGKDLTRVCLPVYFNEPLSALQKIAEDLEYSELLDKAAQCPRGSVERLVWLSAFAVSGYSGTVGRLNKPFNPLLGETYELVHAEKGVRFLAEKVVHHPTVIAAYCEGCGWTLQGDADVKSKFWGRSIELIPEGVLMVTFDDGETYTWNKVTTYINNLILGKIYVDHGGLMRITSRQSGLTAKIRFKEAGMFYDKNPRQVRGHIEAEGKQKLEKPIIHGNWDQELRADMPDGTTWKLWHKNPPAENPTRYCLSSWAITLNEITPGLEQKLAPTDCRLRPDQAHLEVGEYDEANAEKQRLEEKQRAARRAAERGDPIRPRWFDVVPNAKPGKELAFKYKGGYFESRKSGKFEGCRDIFGQTVVPAPGSKA